MTRYIEYYEVAEQDGYEYYFKPINPDALNKQNLDHESVRIWRFDVRRNHIHEIKNRRKDLPQIDPAEFFKIQLVAKPVPYSEYYLRLEEVKRYRAQREAEKSSTED